MNDTNALSSEAPAKRVRLAVVSDAVYPWHNGGKEMRQYRLWGELAAAGVDVHVYTMRWWGRGSRVVHDDVTYHAIMPLVPLYSGERRSVLQAGLFALAGVRLLTQRFDVLETDTIPFAHVPVVWLVSRLKRRPLVAVWHEFWGRSYWREYLGPLGVVAAAVESIAALLPTTVITCSEHTRARVREVRGTRNTTVVANGIDVDAMRALREETSDEKGSGLVVAGRLLAHKNVDLAIEALARLRSEYPDLDLTVIGTGPEADALRDLARARGLQDAVTFTGAMAEHDEVLRRVSRARVLVFPSVREGFGMVALEAMAVGTPVVTSDHPDNAARFLVEDGVTGAICPPTVDGVTAAVRHVLSSPPAGEFDVSAYDWTNLGRELVQTYERIEKERS